MLATILTEAPGYLRIKHQRAHNVSERVSDECTRGVDGLFGVTGDVGCTQANALDPSGREEADKVESHNSPGECGIRELPSEQVSKRQYIHGCSTYSRAQPRMTGAQAPTTTYKRELGTFCPI